jgi:hypothetical protein
MKVSFMLADRRTSPFSSEFDRGSNNEGCPAMGRYFIRYFYINDCVSAHLGSFLYHLIGG